jgi:hypothetical protein
VSSRPDARTREVVAATVLYAFAFVAFTFPLIRSFSTHFFADHGDGLQNVWNIWWVNEAVTTLHELPWRTQYLHYPHGTTLAGHTLNAFNGFVCLPLLRVLTLVQAHNVMVIFGFVAGGLNAFFLCRYLTGDFAGSLAGGFIFTFSSFHFAHAEGHLQLVSLEWVPLFVLSWIALLRRPSRSLSAAAAVTLWLVLLCDYYYFFYCAMFAVLWFVLEAASGALPPRPLLLRGVGGFLLGAALTSGPLILNLLWSQSRDPLIGAHEPNEFSLDLLALVIPGGHWRFNDLTRWYWSKLPGNIHESSVYLGVGSSCLLMWAWSARHQIDGVNVKRWFLLLAFFAVLALGPTLHVAGHAFNWIHLPYEMLVALVPPLRLSGTPVRMVVMVHLCAGVLIAGGFTRFRGLTGWWRAAFVTLVAVTLLELLPRPLPRTAATVPAFVTFLARQPKGLGLMDRSQTIDPPSVLYYQTQHHLPIDGGYISRLPATVATFDHELEQLYRTGDFKKLCTEYGFRFLLLPAGSSSGQYFLQRGDRAVFSGDGVDVFDLESRWKCQASR